jgi:DNA-binding MarR family transcriptional regulator
MALKKAYENDNYSIQEIGKALNFTKSGATKIIDRLENKGYVTREHSSIDGRVCCVTVTTKGMEVISKIMEKYAAYFEEMLEDFEPEIVDKVKDVLEMLVNATRKQGFI